MASNVVATEQKRNETKSKKASKEKVKRVSLKERKVLIQKKEKELEKERREGNISMDELMKKYGELERFKSLINYRPLEYKSLEPKEKKLTKNNNPPKLIVEFFEEQKNIKNITCYSNDGGNWKKSNIKVENQKLKINFDEKFLPRRGRVNCSLNDSGLWRWFGAQFVVKEN